MDRDRLPNNVFRGHNISFYLTSSDMVTFLDAHKVPQQEFIVHKKLLESKAGNWIHSKKPDLTQPVAVPEAVSDVFKYFVDWLYEAELGQVMTKSSYDRRFSNLIKLFDWAVDGSIWSFLNDILDALQDLIYYDKKAKFTGRHFQIMLNSQIVTERPNFCGALIHWSILASKGLVESDLDTIPRLREIWNYLTVYPTSKKWHPCRRIRKSEEEGFDPCAFHFHESDLETLDPDYSWCKRTVSLKPSTRKQLERAPGSVGIDIDSD